MTPSAIYPGLVVKLVPSEFTRSRTNFVPGFDPMIGGVYRVESLDAEGLVYLESGAGPFLPGDLVPAAPDEMHNVVRISREFDMRARLEIGGVKVPGLSEGDRVVCTATWSLPEYAKEQGWPFFGEQQIVESVEPDGLYFKLRSFRHRFPAWHFKKIEDRSGVG